MRARNLMAVLIAVILNLSVTLNPLITGRVTAQTTTTIPMLPGVAQPISVAGGSQVNPHVECNLVSYTYDDFEGSSTIRYVDLATNTEHTLPGNTLDRLSDTDGRRIAFTELGASGDQVFLYDLTSQTTTQIPGLLNSDPAIGGNLVAFLHRTGTANSTFEIGVYDQNTGTVTQLTTDALMDLNPSVSPDGHIIVWEKCQPDTTGCDIYSATQTGPGAFTTRLISGDGNDRGADTNGQLVVYVSNQGGENDIHLRRVDGSNEMRLSIPGDQRDVRISGNLVVFESQTADRSYDVFVYDLSTARLYQVTNTPDVDETLSDIVVGCNGLNRIVYAKPGPFGDFDVHSFTFQLNDSVSDQLNDLIALVRSFDLHDGTEASLIIKLQDALSAVNASNTLSACDSLTAFINASFAQSGKKLTSGQVQQLVQSATQVKSDLGCQ